MAWRNSETEWGTAARFFHWTMAGLFVLQWFAGEFDDAFGGRAFHVSLGTVLLALALLRLAWRLTNPVPAPPLGTPPLSALLARALHGTWYLLMVALPFTGLLYVQAKQKVVHWFGLFQLPLFMDKNKALAEAAEDIHKALATFAVVLLVVHATAAFKHHFIDRDVVLLRMLGR